MPRINLDIGDAAELAEILTFIAGWLAGSQKQILADSLSPFAGHPAYETSDLRADLHRFAFLLGESDGWLTPGKYLTSSSLEVQW